MRLMRHLLCVAWIMISVLPASAKADEINPVARVLGWHNSQIEEVASLFKFGGTMDVAGKKCVTGSALYFKVADQYAFGIDEDVTLEIEFAQDATAGTVNVTHDGNAVFEGVKPAQQLTIPAGAGQFNRQILTLKDARFANLAMLGSDFSINSLTGPFTVCDVKLTRSYTTALGKPKGWAAIEVLDDHGRKTPVRMGIYDAEGRIMLPNDESVALRNGVMEVTRIVELGGFTKAAPAWPMQDRSVYYIDGAYHTRLPAGDYMVVVSKGPEYRIEKRKLTVRPDTVVAQQIRLSRWTDMPAKGWYSGELHFHYPRDSAYDDQQVSLFLQGEDLWLTNDFLMGNIATDYNHHYSWKPVRFGLDNLSVLVPGQEDPRTAYLGHTAHWGISEPYHSKPEHYLLYDETFAAVKKLGGLSGFAHGISPERDCSEDITMSDVERGMALFMPGGNIRFIEVMSVNCMGTSLWFDFLNLGYKLSPAAGTDYPAGAVPGAVRAYAKLDGAFSPEAWYFAFNKGNVFVTSGPTIEFTVNGKPMGSELRVRRGAALNIAAKAALNPDFGAIASIDVIEQGAVVKTVMGDAGASMLELTDMRTAEHGTWLVLQARGKDKAVVAWSAPIYISVDGDRTWKRDAVLGIVSKLKTRMQGVLVPEAPQSLAVEPFDAAATMAKYWAGQQPALKQRVEAANAAYDALVKSASGGK